MSTKIRPFGVHLLAAAVLLSGMPRPAMAGQEVRCESHGLRRAYCPVGRHGTIRLLDSSGIWPCRENETWGVETEGIWVDRGCKGRFFVDDASNRRDKNAAIVAGVVGVGILAAILASKNNKRDDTPPPDTAPPNAESAPRWLVGEYHGYSPAARADASMVVGGSGRVSLQIGNQRSRGVWVGNNQIRFDNGSTHNLSRNPDGLRLTDASKRNVFTDFYRDR